MKLKIPLLSRNLNADFSDLLPLRRFVLPPSKDGGTVPRVAAIVVRGCNGANLIESYNADEEEGTFFGRMTVGAAAELTQTFSIQNVGTAPLKIGRIALEGTGADEFEVTEPAAPVVAPGDSTTFTIRYHGRRAGSAVALVLIPSSDPTERPYLFLIEGYAEAVSGDYPLNTGSPAAHARAG